MKLKINFLYSQYYWILNMGSLFARSWSIMLEGLSFLVKHETWWNIYSKGADDLIYLSFPWNIILWDVYRCAEKKNKFIQSWALLFSSCYCLYCFVIPGLLCGFNLIILIMNVVFDYLSGVCSQEILFKATPINICWNWTKVTSL